MNVLGIAYDVMRPEQSYARIEAVITDLAQQVVHPEQSVWVILTPHDEIQVRDALLSAIESNDKLFVFRVMAAAWYGLGTTGDAAMKSARSAA